MRHPVVVHYGGIPLPVGGVTSHVASLAHETASLGFRSFVVDRIPGEKLPSPATILTGARGLARAVMMRSAVHHFHVSLPKRMSLVSLLALLLVLPRKRSCITFHSGRFPAAYEGPVSRVALRLAGRQVSAWFVLNDRALGYVYGLRTQAEVVRTTSYVASTEPVAVTSLRRRDLVDLRDEVDFLVVTSGYGVPNSGFLELAESLQTVGARCGLAVVDYGDSVPGYLDRVRAVGGNLPLVATGPLPPEEFRALLSAADLYVRNTMSDAFGLAVAEAIDLGTPAIATSVCERAEGCSTYPPDDPSALRTLLRSMLTNRQPSKGLTVSNSLQQYVEVYERLLAKRSNEDA